MIEEKSVLVSLSTTDLTWTGLGSNLTLWGEMHMPDCLNHGMPIDFYMNCSSVSSQTNERETDLGLFFSLLQSSTSVFIYLWCI